MYQLILINYIPVPVVKNGEYHAIYSIYCSVLYIEYKHVLFMNQQGRYPSSFSR